MLAAEPDPPATPPAGALRPFFEVAVPPRLGLSEAQAYAETLALQRVAERVATLDVLSGGRLEVGIGRRFSPREHEVYGAGAVDPTITRESLEVFAREVAPAFRQP